MSAHRIYPIGTHCKECNGTLPIMAKGLCKKCYMRLWARRKSNGGSREEYLTAKTKNSKERKSGTCKTCGRTGKIQSLEQCPRCYKKAVEVIIVCTRCNRERGHAGLGLCHSCYVNTVTNKRKTKKTICSICQQEKIYKAKGLCSDCYRRQHKKNWQKPIIVCSKCGKESKHESLGMCAKCYWIASNGKSRNQIRNSKKKNLPATLTKEEWENILEKHNYSCVYCGISNVPLAQEHWIPMSKGGGYTVDNIVPACKRCNSRKHTMTGDEFLAILQKEKEYAG